MGNTGQRVVSAAVLVGIASLCFYYGEKTTFLLFALMGAVMLDELFCNFFSGKRWSPSYLVAQILYLLPVFSLGFFSQNTIGLQLALFMNIGLNIFLLYYLFFTEHESKIFVTFFKKNPIWSFFIVSLPILSLSLLLQLDQWLHLLILLFLINFGMDTGAWFFGKNFGKRKLLPKVSPKKTVEGLLGGMMTAGVIGFFFWKAFLSSDEKTFTFIAFLPFLAVLSQMGDLIQSKIKRQFGLKDSSALIPGHGGVYDRVDGLVFLTPFFLLIASIYYS